MHSKFLKARRGPVMSRAQRSTRGRLIGLVAVATTALSAGLAVDAGAATGPPPPKTHGGATATLLAGSPLKNVTSMAWGDGAMFAGDSGSSETVPNGGLYVVSSTGQATKIPSSLLYVAGLAWHDGALYISGGLLKGKVPTYQIDRWSGFNGTTFTKQQTLYTLSTKATGGFDGIAFGPGGRLYAGIGAPADHGSSATPYAWDILSMNASGKDVKVFATGIRQPWQMAYAPGTSSLFVSDLGQDGPKAVEKKNPPDFLLKVKQGDDFGFPDCNWTAGSPCGTDTKPFKFFTSHTSIMGLAIIKQTLYMTSFAGLGGKGGGAVYSVPVSGGKVTPVVTGIAGATDALAAHDGDLYVGGSGQKGGLIYEVTP